MSKIKELQHLITEETYSDNIAVISNPSFDPLKPFDFECLFLSDHATSTENLSNALKLPHGNSTGCPLQDNNCRLTSMKTQITLDEFLSTVQGLKIIASKNFSKLIRWILKSDLLFLTSIDQINLKACGDFFAGHFSTTKGHKIT